ncbi:hypothetical protein ACHBIE_05970 [Streptococcus sp. A23]|uniref:hypothetical protein n=1 Tax=Streptococcus sp. A23 TaxID=3373127 RepID=UPI00374DCAD5
MESKSDAEVVQEFYPTLESDYSQIKNSTWQEENKEALGLVDTGLKILAAVALAAGTVMTGGAALLFIDSPWNIEGVEVLDSWYINP